MQLYTKVEVLLAVSPDWTALGALLGTRTQKMAGNLTAASSTARGSVSGATGSQFINIKGTIYEAESPADILYFQLYLPC